MSDWFYEIVRCPITHSALAPASDELLAEVNRRIAEGAVCNRLGERIQEPIAGALTNVDATWLFVVADEIPNLIADEAIPWNAPSDGMQPAGGES